MKQTLKEIETGMHRVILLFIDPLLLSLYPISSEYEANTKGNRNGNAQGDFIIHRPFVTKFIPNIFRI